MSKTSPSKSHRWLVCTGSITFDTEGPESSYAEEGSIAHEVLSQVLQGNMIATGDDIRIGDKTYKATAERIQQAIEVRDFVAQWHQAHPDFVMESEVPIKVSASIGYGDKPVFDGTADVIAYNTKEILVLDAKFGFVRVEPENNPQLYLYAVGLLEEIFRTFGEIPETVTLVIAQPDYEGIMQFREHRARTKDILDWVRSRSERFRWAFGSTLSLGDPDYVPPYFDASDENACRYCPGRTVCLERQSKLVDFAKEEWRMTKTLKDLLPLLPQIRHIADDLEREAVKQLALGMTVPGFKLVESNSVRKWVNNNPPEAEDGVVSMAKDRGLDILTKKIMSPAQVEKAFGAKGKEFTKTWAVKPAGGPKLVPESDHRPEYKPDTGFTQEEIDRLLREE